MYGVSLITLSSNSGLPIHALSDTLKQMVNSGQIDIKSIPYLQ